MRISILFIASLFLVSCSGTGTKNYGKDIAPYINEAPSGKIFILRNIGYAAKTGLITITQNNIEVGSLGENEMLFFDGIAGDNNIKINMSLLGCVGLNSPEVSFKLSTSENKYYIIKLAKSISSVIVGCFASELLFKEVSHDYWNSFAQILN